MDPLVAVVLAAALWALALAAMHDRNVRHGLRSSTFCEVSEIIVSMVIAVLSAPYFLLTSSGEKPRLAFIPTTLNCRVLDGMKTVKSFKETAWLCGHAWLPMLWMALNELTWCNRNTVFVDKEHITMSDGGTVGLFWRSRAHPSAPVVIILPGLNEDASDYPPFVLGQPFISSCNVCVYVRRGQSGLALTSPRPYCLRGVDDFTEVLARLRTRFPAASIAAVGGSTGAGIIMRYCEKAGKSSLLSAACCVDMGVNWTTNWAWFADRHPGLSQGIMMKKMKEVVSANASVFDGSPVNVTAVLGAPDYLSFFGELHAKVLGGAQSCTSCTAAMDGKAYLDWASPSPDDFANIATPLLVMTSDNDFVMQPSARDTFDSLAHSNPCIVTCRTQGGSHTMRCQGINGDGMWLGRVCFEYITAVLEVSEGKASLTDTAAPWVN